MKNCMPNLSEKCSDSFTFARLTHQHRSAGMPSGKLASFFFLGLQSWSEQGTLMGETDGSGRNGYTECLFKTIWFKRAEKV
jgi:hypothetical protein